MDSPEPSSVNCADVSVAPGLSHVGVGSSRVQDRLSSTQTPVQGAAARSGSARFAMLLTCTCCRLTGLVRGNVRGRHCNASFQVHKELVHHAAYTQPCNYVHMLQAGSLDRGELRQTLQRGVPSSRSWCIMQRTHNCATICTCCRLRVLIEVNCETDFVARGGPS